jgi:hypothetical protein
MLSSNEQKVVLWSGVVAAAASAAAFATGHSFDSEQCEAAIRDDAALRRANDQIIGKAKADAEVAHIRAGAGLAPLPVAPAPAPKP